MMGVCEEYLDLTENQTGIPTTEHMTSNWRGKGVGIFLMRAMYLYYNQIHPLSSGEVFFKFGTPIKTVSLSLNILGSNVLR